MHTNAQRQKIQAQLKTAPAKEPGAVSSTAVPNSVMASMMGVSDRGGYAIPNLDQIMRERFALARQIPSAEQEADRLAQGAAGAKTPDEVKSRLGESMGADFSSVRFHTGGSAQGKADSMGARAYTSGRDVYFGEGGFDPSVAAHELVHTAQQGFVSSAVDTMSAPAGGVQMMPKALDWLWRKTGGKLIRDNHDAMEEMYRHQHVDNDWGELTEENIAEFKRKNPIAYRRYMNNPEVQAQVKARYEKHQRQQADAAQFLAAQGTGKTSRLGTGSGDVDLAETPEPESLGDKVTDVMDKAGSYVGDPAGEVSDLVDHIPTKAAEVIGEHTGQVSDGIGMLSDLNEGGQEAIQMIKAIKEGDKDAAKEHGANAGKAALGVGGGIAEKIADSGAPAQVVKQAGHAADVISLVQDGINIYEGGKQAYEGGKQRSAMGDLQKKLGDRENLEGEQLLERDIATQGKMEGTRQIIQGTGKALSAGLNASGTAATMGGASAPVGAALKGASKAVDIGTTVASNAQKGRTVDKVTEQATGVTEEKIDGFIADQRTKGVNINRSRAKQRLLQAQDFRTGYRAEVHANQTQLRSDAVAQSANTGGTMGTDIVNALNVKPDEAGQYDPEQINQKLGGDGQDAQKQILRDKFSLDAMIADNRAAKAAAEAAAPAPLVAGLGTKTSDETMSYRQHTGQGQRLDFDPTTMSDDESLAMMFDSIKRHEAAGDMDPEQLSHLKREFAQARARQMDAQYKKDNPTPPPTPATAKKEPPKKDKKWYQFWK